MSGTPRPPGQRSPPLRRATSVEIVVHFPVRVTSKNHQFAPSFPQANCNWCYLLPTPVAGEG
jgi:hypothetical protein